MRRHGESQVRESTPEGSPRQVHASAKGRDRSELSRELDDAPDQMRRVAIDAQASPGQVVRYFRGEVERRPAEHLGQITGGRTDVMRKDALRPTALDDVDDVGIRRQIFQRWEKHDER
jgi:hypothetical protein